VRQHGIQALTSTGSSPSVPFQNVVDPHHDVLKMGPRDPIADATGSSFHVVAEIG